MTATRRRHLQRHHPRGRCRPPHPLPRRGHQRRRHHPPSPASTTPSIYRGLVVPHGITSPIPVLRVVHLRRRLQHDGHQPHGRHHPRPARIAYGGMVIDNVEVNIKGHASQSAPKVELEVRHARRATTSTCRGLLVEPVDEFDMQADWSDQSHGRGHPLLGRLPARRGRRTTRCSRSAPSATEPSRASTTSTRSSTAPGASARATTTTSSSRPRPARSTRPGRSTSASARRPPTTTDFAPLAAFVNGVALDRNRPSATTCWAPPTCRR